MNTKRDYEEFPVYRSPILVSGWGLTSKSQTPIEYLRYTELLVNRDDDGDWKTGMIVLNEEPYLPPRGLCRGDSGGSISIYLMFLSLYIYIYIYIYI